MTISDMPLAQIEACKQRRTVQSWVRSGRRRPYGGLPPGILVTEPVHPDVAAWWPPGHALGYVLRSLPI